MLSIMRFYEQASRQDGSHPYFIVSFVFLIVLNLISIAYFIFNSVVAVRVKYYKTNIQRIHHAIYITCPISSGFLIAQKIVDIIGGSEEYEDDMSVWVHYFRTAAMSPPLFSLTAIMLERVCATWFIRDYEQKQRPFIAYSIIVLLYFIAALTSYVFNATDLIFVYVAAHLFLNIFCYVVSLLNYRINRNYYHKNRVTKHEYSLGERYQISENIRMYKFFSKFLFVLAFFTIFCTSLALLSNYDSAPFHRNVFNVLFDLSYTLLCIYAPYFLAKMSEAWQNELNAIMVKIGIRKPPKTEGIVFDRSRNLKNTFGEQMDFETGKRSEMYFDQLKKTWIRGENASSRAIMTTRNK